MKFLWSTLVVNNIEEAVKFYTEAVGLKEARRMKTPQGTEIVFLGEGETQVELMESMEKKHINMGSDISLGFSVDSVDAKIAELKGNGIAIHSGPFQPAPYVKFFYVLDPDGLKIQFVEQIH